MTRLASSSTTVFGFIRKRMPPSARTPPASMPCAPVSTRRSCSSNTRFGSFAFQLVLHRLRPHRAGGTHHEETGEVIAGFVERLGQRARHRVAHDRQREHLLVLHRLPDRVGSKRGTRHAFQPWSSAIQVPSWAAPWIKGAAVMPAFGVPAATRSATSSGREGGGPVGFAPSMPEKKMSSWRHITPFACPWYRRCRA